jgi:hypothetical protein
MQCLFDPDEARSGGNVKSDGSWVRLIAFCAGAALISALALAVLFVGTAVGFSAGGNSNNSEASSPNAMSQIAVAGDRAYTGVITDDHCGARHERDSGKNPAECARMCIRNGSSYVLVDGDRKYDLDGSADELGKLAGQRAKVMGTLSGTTIKVSSLTSGE